MPTAVLTPDFRFSPEIIAACSRPQPAEVMVRREPAPLHIDFVPRGRPTISATCGRYVINAYRRRCDESRVVAIHVLASLHGTVVGHLNGYSMDLKRFSSADGLIIALDSIDQGTYDAAEAVKDMGPGFWRKRDLLLFLDSAEVQADHRLQGLGRAMAHACAGLAQKTGRNIDILAQPYPLTLETVPPEEVGARKVLSQAEWDAELAGVTACWLKTFPCLRRSVSGGLAGDRDYYFGRQAQN